MHSLRLSGDAASPLKVLCLGAHSDDIEIGCGGTILRLAAQYPKAVFHWVVFSSSGVRAAEAKRAAKLFAGSNSLRGPLLKTYQDGFMPYVGAEVKADLPRPHLHPQSPRCTPGSPPARRIDLEHVP